jgi:hypothetical protein
MFHAVWKSACLICLGCLISACAYIKRTGRTIGHTTRDVTREIGHGARDVTRDIGHGTRDVVRDVRDEITNSTKPADEPKKAVKPTAEKSEY